MNVKSKSIYVEWHVKILYNMILDNLNENYRIAKRLNLFQICMHENQ